MPVGFKQKKKKIKFMQRVLEINRKKKTFFFQFCFKMLIKLFFYDVEQQHQHQPNKADKLGKLDAKV